MKSLGIEHIMATPGHHETNGQAERKIRELKTALRNMVNKRQTNWATALPETAAYINAAHSDTLNMSPYRAVYGRDYPLLSTIKFVKSRVPPLDDYLNRHQALPNEAYQAVKQARSGAHVLLQSAAGLKNKYYLGRWHGSMGSYLVAGSAKGRSCNHGGKGLERFSISTKTPRIIRWTLAQRCIAANRECFIVRLSRNSSPTTTNVSPAGPTPVLHQCLSRRSRNGKWRLSWIIVNTMDTPSSSSNGWDTQIAKIVGNL